MGLGFGGERYELAYEKRAVLPEAAHQLLFPACQFFHHTGFGFCYPPCSDRPTGLTGTKVTKKTSSTTILNSFSTIFFSFTQNAAEIQAGKGAEKSRGRRERSREKAGKRPGEIGKDDYTGRQAWKGSARSEGLEKKGREMKRETKKPRLFQPGHMDTGTNGD